MKHRRPQKMLGSNSDDDGFVAAIKQQQCVNLIARVATHKTKYKMPRQYRLTSRRMPIYGHFIIKIR
jgi:hypothetical protein